MILLVKKVPLIKICEHIMAKAFSRIYSILKDLPYQGILILRILIKKNTATPLTWCLWFRSSSTGSFYRQTYFVANNRIAEVFIIIYQGLQRYRKCRINNVINTPSGGRLAESINMTPVIHAISSTYRVIWMNRNHTIKEISVKNLL